MKNTLHLAMAQMTSTNAHGGNIAAVQDAALQAADKGCDLLALPEAAGLMNADFASARGIVTSAEADPFIAACQAAAADHGIWLHLGSTPVAGPGGKFLNHSALIDPQGRIHARYDKIHLFDVHLSGHAPTGESDRYAPGETAVLAETPWGLWGMSICYDLRFPHLYRDYAMQGARVLFIPSAFTVPTGQAHWEVLLRARAIETGAFVIAAAQVGIHDDGRSTWGHGLIIDPWGRVLTDMGGRETGVSVTKLDLTEVEAARAQIPSLRNGCDYEMLIAGAAGET